jgi:cell wall-associated NlpC family hydrolase
VRLAAAALIGLSIFAALPSSPSAAAPSRAEIAAAEAQLNAMNARQSALDEQYNLAAYRLHQAQQQLAQAQSDARHAQAAHARAVRDLSRRVKAAYEGAGSTLDVLLRSRTVSALSDRAEFLGQIAQGDELAATNASVTGQNAHWAADRLRHAVQARTAAVRELSAKKAELVRSIADQRSAIAHMKAALRQAILARQARLRRLAELQRQREAAAAARRAAAARSATPAPSSGSSSQSTQFVPPANASQAQIAIDAARSQLGVPYVYGASQPGVGFDCSGLTMWAWGQAGVSMAHVAAIQYSEFPHVDRSQLQPGDLVFFYSPIHHVGIYVGGGMMIDAPHTGAYVEEAPVYWSAYSGAARP